MDRRECTAFSAFFSAKTLKHLRLAGTIIIFIAFLAIYNQAENNIGNEPLAIIIRSLSDNCTLTQLNLSSILNLLYKTLINFYLLRK